MCVALGEAHVGETEGSFQPTAYEELDPAHGHVNDLELGHPSDEPLNETTTTADTMIISL